MFKATEVCLAFLFALYRTEIRIFKMYLKILFHLIDISKVNGWFLYKRHRNQLKVPKSKVMSLLKFTSAIARALTMAGKVVSRPVGRPSKNGAVSLTPVAPKKSKSNPMPSLLGLINLDIGQNLALIKTSVAHVYHQLEEFTA